MLAIGKGFSPKILLNDAFFQASEVVTAGKNAVWMWKKLCCHGSGNFLLEKLFSRWILLMFRANPARWHCKCCAYGIPPLKPTAPLPWQFHKPPAPAVLKIRGHFLVQWGSNVGGYHGRKEPCLPLIWLMRQRELVQTTGARWPGRGLGADYIKEQHEATHNEESRLKNRKRAGLKWNWERSGVGTLSSLEAP